jgi:VCBS repeat-containing protein/YVTN family beta-propeller protein
MSLAATQQSAVEVPEALTAPAVTNPIQAVSNLISSVVRPVLSTFLGMLPGGTTESPLAWIFLAAARRQVGLTEEPAADVSVERLAATQTVAAAVANQPPTAAVAWGRPDATTGKVLGQLTTSDPEGKAVTVALKSAPTAGTFAYNATTKVITYTPTTAQRFVAATTSTPADTIGMTITVSDGVNKVDVPLNIPVSPSPFYNSDDFNASDPSAVAATNTRAYITNRTAGTVTVYDTVKGTVVGTYQVGASPDGVAVKKDGTRLYVSSSTNNTVTVIDTSTGLKKATLTVANPTAIAINPAGTTVYVTNGNTATVTKITTSTNKLAGTVKLATGLTPTELAVSADGKKIYVASAKSTGGGNISVFAYTATTATSVTDIAGAPTGLALSQAFPRLFAVDAAGGVTLIDTSTNAAVTRNFGIPLTGVAITNDSSAVMITDNTGLLAALSSTDGSTLGVIGIRDVATPMSVQPGVVLSPDGTQMFVTDYDTDSVHVVSLVPPNTAPFSSAPSYTVSNPTTGALAGKVGVVDFDGDPLTYVVNTKPTKGTLVLKADGTYTYTPTATARHAAAVPGAPDSVTTDSFTLTVSDGRNGTLTETITVDIPPANLVPTVKTTIGAPSTTTGIVKGSVVGTDGNSDKKTYTVTGAPTKGAVTVTTAGAFTYTPTAAARAAATAPGATHADKMDTFTVTVDDGHGGVVPVTVNVKIGAANVKPTGAKATVANTNPRTGVVTGALTGTDADGDTLTYTTSKPVKGTIVVNPDGSFTYTPTAAARLAASKAGASSTTKSETITITVSDGFGGVTTTSLKVSIAPNPTTNNAPTNGHEVQGDTKTSTAIGTVTGTVTADDLDSDPLTYSLGSGPAFGKATVTSDGKFTYTPDVDARYRALVTPNVDTDTFTVNISDGFGGTTTATVNVEIAPPSDSAVDQRPTEVAVTAQQMYFYSQTDTNKSMALLKGAGIDTIRILMPWGGVEKNEGTYDWSATDRMINSANANGIKVLAVINSTPDWAATPDQPPLAGAPVDLDAFNDFVTQVATRYQGKVTDYEIWNEQNADIFWAPEPDAAQYTALLKVAYTAIKSADPNAVVIAGGLASAAETPGGPTINPVTFLSEMYADGAAGYFDAVAYHPYLYSVPFSAGEGHAGVPITQAEQMYAVMVANGDGNKKIWATEYGEPSSEVSEATQAAYVGDFLREWRTLEFAGPAFIHTLADYSSSDPIQGSFGLFHQDWTPKPALTTVEQVIAENQAINAAADEDVL